MLVKIPSTGNMFAMSMLFFVFCLLMILKICGWTGGYFSYEHDRNVEFQHSNTTVDCVTWEPVELKTNNGNFRTEGRQEWIYGKIVENVESESREHRNESFSEIFDKNVWGNREGSRSGAGSLLENAGRIISVLNILVDKIKENTGKRKISLLDSSCGDMTWMPTFLEHRADVDFTGYDIVKANIDNHRQKFDGKGWNFEVHDIVGDPINKFDIILSRHTMIHLKNMDVVKVLKQFYDSGSTYLLATNFPDIEGNDEVDENSAGRWRMINLHLPPFYLPPPVCQSHGDGEVDYIYISLWALSLLS